MDNTALLAARAAEEEFQRGGYRDAAWLALYSLEQGGNGWGWSILARVELEVTGHDLAMLGLLHALDLGLPDSVAAEVGRLQRMHFWGDGLLGHVSGEPVLQMSEFEVPGNFVPNQLEPWLEQRLVEWGGMEGAMEALRRKVAATSGAWEPPAADDPLRSNDWSPMPAFQRWRDVEAPRALEEAAQLNEAQESRGRPRSRSGQLSVLSDLWMERVILAALARADHASAIERARLWVARRPKKMQPKVVLAEILHLAGDATERERAVEEILAFPSEQIDELEHAREALGQIALWPAQVRLLDRMLRLMPNHPVLLTHRGVAYFQLDQLAEARRDLEAALAQDGNFAPALANLGLLEMRNSNLVAARQHLERAVTLAPERPEGRVFLAACKHNQGDRAGALADLEQLLLLAPDHQPALNLKAEILKLNPY